jgi:Nodulation protein S (NodS)
MDNSTRTAYFEQHFARSDDPWGFHSRWYEERKRQMTVACLPSERYACGFEPGCANARLSAELALRCDRLHIWDGNARAVALAKAQCAPLTNVQVQQGWIPDQWPTERFDLIVISELGYFLDEHQLIQVSKKIRDSLMDNGAVLACHWRHPIAGFKLRGDDVHELFEHQLALANLSTVIDADFRIDVWCADTRSVARREGLG